MRNGKEQLEVKVAVKADGVIRCTAYVTLACMIASRSELHAEHQLEIALAARSGGEYRDAGLLRIAWLNRLKTSARKLPFSRSVTGNLFSSAELMV